MIVDRNPPSSRIATPPHPATWWPAVREPRRPASEPADTAGGEERDAAPVLTGWPRVFPGL